MPGIDKNRLIGLDYPMVPISMYLNLVSNMVRNGDSDRAMKFCRRLISFISHYSASYRSFLISESGSSISPCEKNDSEDDELPF